MKKMLTLAMVLEEDRVLLGMKKRGFGAGRWNGFGGKVEEGETVKEAAQRELYEEVSLTAADLHEAGVLEFSFADREDVLEVHIFRVDSYTGVPVETEEMRPAWFLVDEIPFNDMWADDVYWLPYLLKGKRFAGSFHFDTPATSDYPATILRQTINELP